MHYPIDLSSGNVIHRHEISLLNKGPSFCPIPRDINWHKCRLDWQAFVDKVRRADFYFDREPIHNSNTSAILPDDLGPFNTESDVRTPVSKDIALENFLAAVENKLFDAERSRREPEANISRAEIMALCQLRKSKDIVVRLQDKGSRFVILETITSIKLKAILVMVHLIFLVWIHLFHFTVLLKIGVINGWD